MAISPLRASDWLSGVYGVETLVKTGDSSERLDVAMVSSGYSKAKAKDLKAMSQKVFKKLLGIEPFKNYKDYINAHLVYIDDSSQPKIATQVNEDILTCDRRAAYDYGELAPDHDVILVLTNTRSARSTAAGKVITLARDGNMGDVFIHEMGHAFANLADEYVDSVFGSRRDPKWAERWVNTTLVSEPSKSKWHYWMPSKWYGAHMENILPRGVKINHAEGGYYVSKGVWRPETNCRMRSSRGAKRFCLVCFEEIEKQFYRFISPIEETSPRNLELKAWKGEKVNLMVKVIDVNPSGGKKGKFKVLWYLDGKAVASKNKKKETELTVDTRRMDTGKYEVAFRVDFVNGNVRRDNGWLSGSRAWVIEVSSLSKPRWRLPTKLTANIGEPLEFKVDFQHATPEAFEIRAVDKPAGSVWENGQLSWTPTEDQHGCWPLKVQLASGNHMLEETIPIMVKKKKNRSPTMGGAKVMRLKENVAWTFDPEIEDSDGDHLYIKLEDLPDGMEFDPQKRIFSWTPDGLQAGAYDIEMQILDGHVTVRKKLRFVVEEGKPSKSSSSHHRDLLQLSRSRDARDRAWALMNMKDLPPVLRWLEHQRLCRDSDYEVRKIALEGLRNSLNDAEQWRAPAVKEFDAHMWAFTDHSEITEYASKLAEEEKKLKESRAILKTSKMIEAYNRKRGM